MTSDTLNAAYASGASGKDYRQWVKTYDGPILSKDQPRWQTLGYGNLPVCMAKTQNSLSDDAKKLGRPRGFTVTVRDAKLAAGAGFVVAYAGDILTMPGLPKAPGAETMDVDADGNVVGLF